MFHDNGEYRAKAKVSPPRLNGAKVGVFASRSPHRPNNVGMSLVKLEKVLGDTLHVSAVDLIDGTPILDIKPYISTYDCPLPPVSQPTWIAQQPSSPLSINFTDGALEQIVNLQYSGEAGRVGSGTGVQLRFMRSMQELRECIEDILAADPRSRYRRAQGDTEFSFPIDAVDVRVRIREGEGDMGEGEGPCSGKRSLVEVLEVAQTPYVKSLLELGSSDKCS